MKDKLIGFLAKEFDRYANLFLIFMAIVLFFSLSRSLARTRAAKKEIDDARVKVEKLQVENNTLEEELKKVESEQFVEKQLRDNLGMAREGEIVIVLPDEGILRKLAPSYQPEDNTLPDPNWKRWRNLFF